MDITLREEYLKQTLADKDIKTAEGEFIRALEYLTKKTGDGHEYLGWLGLPSSISQDEIQDIKITADRIRRNSEMVVFIGIGGSYLGARAVIEGIHGPFYNSFLRPQIYYAGNNISSDYMSRLVELIKDRDVSLVVISKSGTTTEPAISFRILKKELGKKYGKNTKDHIVAITDKAKGALRSLANTEGWKTYTIPDDVGGRFSVLTPVGLLPIAIAGIDITKLIAGARTVEEETRNNAKPLMSLNRYAIIRNALYRKGKKIEILANFEPALHYLTEWWKQLYGESEGKNNKGLFPAGVDFTTDLHSMGQWIQEGERTIFETFLLPMKSRTGLKVENEANDLDELNYLAGKSLHEINEKAYEGTAMAHFNGSVPNLAIQFPEINENCLGQLIYFFEKACGISGYMLAVNPFNQPGVEEYKKNMFRLLKKPGY